MRLGIQKKHFRKMQLMRFRIPKKRLRRKMHKDYLPLKIRFRLLRKMQISEQALRKMGLNRNMFDLHLKLLITRR